MGIFGLVAFLILGQRVLSWNWPRFAEFCVRFDKSKKLAFRDSHKNEKLKLYGTKSSIFMTSKKFNVRPFWPLLLNSRKSDLK